MQINRDEKSSIHLLIVFVILGVKKKLDYTVAF